MSKRIEYKKGELIGKLIYLEEVKVKPPQSRRAIFKCKCGKEFESNISSVKSGKTVSCKCHSIETHTKRLTTHGKNRTPEHIAWKSIKERCLNTNSKSYNDYGGRGIIICESWINSFQTFLLDMGERPNNKSSIDRIDVDGNYEPINCRWSDYLEQGNNKRNNRRVTFFGQNLTISQWAKLSGLNSNTLHERIFKLDWPLSLALTLPALKVGNMKMYYLLIKKAKESNNFPQPYIKYESAN